MVPDRYASSVRHTAISVFDLVHILELNVNVCGRPEICCIEIVLLNISKILVYFNLCFLYIMFWDALYLIGLQGL